MILTEGQIDAEAREARIIEAAIAKSRANRWRKNRKLARASHDWQPRLSHGSYDGWVCAECGISELEFMAITRVQDVWCWRGDGLVEKTIASNMPPSVSDEKERP